MKLTQAYNDVGEDLKGIHFQKSKINGSIADQIEEYFSKAAQYAELLVQKFPDRAESYFLLASSYGHMALFKGGNDKVRLARDVEKNCKKAIELNPRYTPAYIALGVYYREVAKLGWAQKAFAKALFGGLPAGTEEDSKRILLQAVELDPNIIHTYFELAKTYDEMNEPDKVVEQLEKIENLPEVDHMDQEIKTEAEKELERLAKNNGSE